MYDEIAVERRVRALVHTMATSDGVNYTVKFRRSQKYAGTHTIYTESRVHIITFSHWSLQGYEAGRRFYPGYKCTEHLWTKYGVLQGLDAEWALVLHEMAHAVQCERHGWAKHERHHGHRYQTIVTELQQRFPPPNGAGRHDVVFVD